MPRKVAGSKASRSIKCRGDVWTDTVMECSAGGVWLGGWRASGGNGREVDSKSRGGGGVGGRDGGGVAAEGRAGAAGGHALGGGFRRRAGADREAVPETLGDRHDVGRDAGPFMGEQLAGAAHAALHFVEDEQKTELVGDRAELAQIIKARRPDAAFALHRLDQDGGGLRRDRGL